MFTDIRWQQRFQNFEKAFRVFKRRVEEYRQNNNNEAFRMALIQSFEVTIELAWKTLKDYLAYEGTIVNSPKQVIRQAYQFTIIDNGEIWMEALEKRNLTTHTYDEEVFNQVLLFIDEKFTPVVEQMYNDFQNKIN